MLLRLGLAWGAVAVLAAGPAWAAPSDAPHARVGEAIDLVRAVERVADGPARVDAELRSCASLESAPASCATVETCRRALIETFDGLVAEEGSRFVRLTVARARSLLADAVFALGPVLDSACREGGVPRTTPRLRVGVDGQTLRLRPVQALRPGRRYALEVAGLPASGLEATMSTFTARPSPERAVEEVEELSRGWALLQKLADEPGDRSEGSAQGWVQIRLPKVLDGATLAGLRARVVPERLAGSEPGFALVGRWRVVDPRVELRSARAALWSTPCAGLELKPTEEAPHVLGGAYPSRSLLDGRPTTAPVLFSPPDPFRTSGPVVVLVDGFTGSAHLAMQRHARALTRRGLGVLAIDLPLHGARGADYHAFLSLEDPAQFAAHLRQATTDVMAIVRAVAECPLRMPGGRSFRASSVAYAGYSMGAMVGALVRAVEPELGATALFAPAGDLADWLKIRLVQLLTELPYVRCLGGSDHEASCFPDGVCTAPGVCTLDPHLFWLTESLETAFATALAPAEPLAFATLRTGAASAAPLLLATGGRDGVLHIRLQERLVEAYGMHRAGPNRWRGPRSHRIHWPDLGHELVDDPAVRSAAYAFLESGGRSVSRPEEGVSGESTAGGAAGGRPEAVDAPQKNR